ncbi:MAG TPA: hypothetical protein QF800_03265 [Phycisphaerales bacterium]|nr:hypothetical protein [Phycisphaerales bacterium]
MPDRNSHGLSPDEVVDQYFLEHRAKLLDLAAFLDRVDRSGGGHDEDFRIAFLRRAMALLDDGQGDRVRRIQLLLSDQTSEPIQQAPMQGAYGAPPATDA